MILPSTAKEFLDRYWLKEELVKICKELSLPASGSKEDLLEHICCFIEKRPIAVKKREIKKRSTIQEIKPDMLIDENYSNDENHRRFFLSQIGRAFKYNVQFMNWMKENKGKKTYAEAVAEWKRICELKRKGVKNPIGRQFEYNQYTRDFFAHNKGLTQEDCRKCWEHKKKKSGPRRYEDSDLTVLDGSKQQLRRRFQEPR